jgi:hypothetical protein
MRNPSACICECRECRVDWCRAEGSGVCAGKTGAKPSNGAGPGFGGYDEASTGKCSLTLSRRLASFRPKLRATCANDVMRNEVA